MRIEGLGPAGVINIKGFKDIISKLGLGDKVSAQVVDLDESQITLRFSNGTTVTASMAVPLDVMLGDFLDLVVKSKSDSQIVMETAKNSFEETKSKEVVDTLFKLKLPPDERNIEIGRALINQRMPMTKGNFSEVLGALTKFEGINIEKAAFIVANNIDSIENGAEILDKFENNETEMGKLLNKLIKTLSVPQNTEYINSIIKDFDNVLKSKASENEAQKLLVYINSYNKTDGQDQDIVASITKQTINQAKNVKDTVDTLLHSSISERRLEFLIEDNELNRPIIEFLEKNPQVNKKLLSFLNNKHELRSFILEYSKQIPEIFKDTPFHERDTILDRLKSFFKDSTAILKGSGIKNDLDVNKIYTNLLYKIDVIEKSNEKYGLTNGEKMGSIITEIRENVNFMNNINNLFNFVQVPLLLNRKETTMDLYVVKNGKERSKIDPDNATVFISLDTQNVGTVESLVNVKYGRVELNFRLDDDNIIAYFASRKHVLEELLKGQGYEVGSIKFALNPKRTNILSFERLIRENKNIIKDVIDVRV